jgi:hypothetical protein
VFHLSNPPAMEDAQFLMLTYSTGIVLIFGTFLMLYQHAWNTRVHLQLSPAAESSLRYGQRAHLLTCGLGLLSIAIALVAGDTGWIAVAGLIYGLMGPLHSWNGYRQGKALGAIDRSS